MMQRGGRHTGPQRGNVQRGAGACPHCGHSAEEPTKHGKKKVKVKKQKVKRQKEGKQGRFRGEPPFAEWPGQ